MTIAGAGESMMVIIMFLAVGYATGQKAKKDGQSSELLNIAVLDWLLPIAILFNVSAIRWNAHVVFDVGACILITGIDALLVLLACWLLRADVLKRRTLLVVVPIGNTAYFGYVAVQGLLGARFLGDAILFDQIGTTLMLATYGNFMARVDRRVGRESGSGVDLLRFRPLWGFAAGVVIGLVGINLFDSALHAVGTAATAALLPVSMLALGSKLAEKRVVADRYVAVGVGIRIIVGPVIILAMVALAATVHPWQSSALLQSAMPSAIGAALLAERRGLDGQLAYSLCGVGVVVACIALPVLVLVMPR